MLLGYGGMGLFMVGRMGGGWIMARIRAERVLLACAIGATCAIGVLLTGAGVCGIVAFLCAICARALCFPPSLVFRCAEWGTTPS